MIQVYEGDGVDPKDVEPKAALVKVWMITHTDWGSQTSVTFLAYDGQTLKDRIAHCLDQCDCDDTETTANKMYDTVIHGTLHAQVGDTLAEWRDGAYTTNVVMGMGPEQR